MEHLTEELIEQLVEGNLTASERELANAHAFGCDDCMHRITLTALSLKINRRIQRLLYEEEFTAEELQVA